MSEKIEIDTADLFKRLVPIILVLTVILAFMAGILWQKVSNLEKGTTKGTETEAQPDGQPDPSSVLGIESLGVYAEELELNEEDFSKCLEEGKYEQAVKDDLAEGQELGVSGTPAFFLNGLLISGAQPYDVFKDAIEYELKGGDWASPDDSVAYLVDEDFQNGEIGIDRVEVSVGDAQTKGDENASVTLVEYSDFECPFCARFSTQTLPQILEEYVNSGKVRIAFKHFPLPFHASAQKAAEASMCAGEQGKFWEYHDKLVEAMGASL